MSPPDFTRWNRAGLARLAYVDGNAALFLDELRAELRARFGDRWSTLPTGADVVEDDGESNLELVQQQRNLRLVDQFYGTGDPNREIAWELGRALSRSAHVLAAHVDAHANETFLRTANEWESVRRIVDLIDYHPAPATSAATDIVVTVKPGKDGVLPRGFPIKYSPRDGGAPIVFETLEDVEVHAELNELRPAGWDGSDGPAAPGGVPAAPPPPVFPPLALAPATVLEGVDRVRGAILDRLFAGGAGGCAVKDLVDVDPRDARLTGQNAIPEAWMREIKIKAFTVAGFVLEPGWDAVGEWPLPDVAARAAQDIADLTGKSADAVRAFQRRVELLGACLDDGFYAAAHVRDLGVAPVAPAGVETTWFVPQKPKVVAGQIAMVWNRAEQRGEAVRIDKVDAATQRLSLAPSPLEHTWPAWPKQVARLRVTPRWKRKAWLNGVNVVRTREPHGLSKGAFVAWRRDGQWRFAEVIEADQRDLRLRTGEPLPTDGTELVQALPLDAARVAPTMEFGLVGAAIPAGSLASRTLNDSLPPAAAADFLNPPAPPTHPPAGPPLMPPGSLSFGSFLFPSPFLPMDLVKAAVELLLSIGAMVIPSTGEPVFKFIPPADIAAKVTDLLAKLPDELWKAGLTPAQKHDKLTELLSKGSTTGGTVLFKEVSAALQQILVVHGPLLGVPAGVKVKAVVTPSVPRYVCAGAPDKIEVGDWVVGEFVDGLRALQVDEITLLGGGDVPTDFGVTFHGFDGSAGELHFVHADFRGELEPAGSHTNESPIDPARIALAPLPATLKRGRKVLITAPGRPPSVAQVVDVDAGGVRLEPPPPPVSKADLVIRGNVVAAGHGAAKPPKQLSSGAATEHKSLVLDATSVSTIADPTFPTGVRADLEVRVGNVIYKQVPRLDGSGPTDPVYAVLATEEGALRLVFGDGVHGRRIASGANNVRVSFRVGAGRAGNVPAGSLIKPVHPHPLVAALEQPKDAVGGEEMESVDKIRQRAPGTLLALERSVSIADFENLAASRNDVWQAKAFYLPGGAGRLDLVRVVVVPAGGGDVEGSVKADLEAFLGQSAIPTVVVRVDGYVKHEVALDVSVRVDSARFDPIEVAERVRSTLPERLGLERRAIADTLFLSEVYRLVEGVEGVADSSCVFRGSGALHVSAQSDAEVVYLGADSDDLRIEVQEYVP